MEFIGSNVVIAANQFNPSILTQLWLIRHGIIDEEDYGEGSAHTPVFVNIQGPRFRLLVVPQQLQFAPQCPPEQEANLVAQKVGTIVESLPYTPYQAVGLNFTWQVVRADADVVEIGRRLFFAERSPLHARFGGGDARFGGYLSRGFEGCRLNLEVKPATVGVQGGVEERLQFFFNFHLDVGEDSVPRILRMLDLWNRAKEESQRTVEAAVG